MAMVGIPWSIGASFEAVRRAPDRGFAWAAALLALAGVGAAVYAVAQSVLGFDDLG